MFKCHHCGGLCRCRSIWDSVTVIKQCDDSDPWNGQRPGETSVSLSYICLYMYHCARECLWSMPLYLSVSVWSSLVLWQMCDWKTSCLIYFFIVLKKYFYKVWVYKYTCMSSLVFKKKNSLHLIFMKSLPCHLTDLFSYNMVV